MTDTVPHSPAGAGRLAGRTALITGASRGLGAAIAQRFAREGAHVILTARTVGGLEETDDAVRAAGGQATLVPMDLRTFEEIDLLGPNLYPRFPKLDVVVLAAAQLGDLSPVAQSNHGSWHGSLDVNLTANYRLLRTLDPLLRGAEAGRVIAVTDAVASGAVPFWFGYAVSKAGLETLIRLYAAEVATTTRIRANLVRVPPLRTRLRAGAYPGEDQSRLADPAEVTEAFVDLASADWTGTGEILDAAGYTARSGVPQA